MGFSVGGDANAEDEVLAEINVTPLVDVMLVLLIIFMIAAPMLHQGVEVALPRADAANLPMRVEDPLVVSVDRDGNVYLQETRIATEDLVERLTDQIKARGNDSVFLKGDRDVPYGRIIEVLDVLHRGGIVHVGMVTEKPVERPKQGRRS